VPPAHACTSDPHRALCVAPRSISSVVPLASVVNCESKTTPFKIHNRNQMPKNGKTRTSAGRLVSRAALAKKIAQILDERGLTQTEAGYITREAPSQISLIVNGHLDGFSPERLLRTLATLGQDIEIRISKSKRGAGKVRVVLR